MCTMVKDNSSQGGFDAKAVKEAMDALLSVLPDDPTDAGNGTCRTYL